MIFKVKTKTLIFCIGGKAGSGKSLFGNYLRKELLKRNYKVVVSPYTKYLKQYIREITGKTVNNKNKPRALLQQLSSKVIKDKLGYKNFFIDRQIEDVSIYKYFFDVIIIPDVRFPDEIDALKKRFENVISIGIKRNNYNNGLTAEEKKDITETSLDNYNGFDYILNNQGNASFRYDAVNIIDALIRGDKMNKVIAIDGPAGSGKGTLAKALAKKYNMVNIDTGATYRCVALKVLRNNIDLSNEKEIIKISKNINIDLKEDGSVYMDGEDVTKEIRSKDVTKIVSPVSSIVEVRKNLVKIQRKIAKNKDIVMEGRDITTVVFPDAKYKFYLDADIEERARRRYKENIEKGINMSFDEVLENIKVRDYNDMHKEVGSLMRTDDQIYIDSTKLTVDEEVEIVDKELSK